jgi:hypothetical protein
VSNVKERLIRGMSYRKVVPVTLPDGEQVEVTIRPLSDCENTTMQGLLFASLGAEFDLGKLEMGADMGKQLMKSLSGEQMAAFSKGTANINAQVCAWCIVDEDGKSIFTLAEVAQGFSGGITEQITAAIRQWSGTTEDEVTPFRA